MPTVIDQLVVELGLDPSAFTEGQRKATAQLRQFETAAGQSSRRIEGTMREVSGLIDRHFGTHFTALFDNLGKAFGTTDKHLAGIGAQARRTGDASSKAIDAATVSTNKLVFAGLAAYAAFKSVQGVVKGVAETLKGAESAFFSAQFAGVKGQYLTSFANAAFKKTGIAPEQTYGFLEQLRAGLESYQLPTSPGYAKISPLIQSLVRIGVRDPMHISSEGALDAISDYLAKLPAQQRLAAAQGFGVPAGLVPVLAQGSAAIHQQQAQIGGPDDEQLRKAHELEEAFRGVLVAWNNLIVKIESDLAPAFGPMLKDFDDWLKELGGSEQGLKKTEAAVGLVATAIGVTLVASIAKLVQAIVAGNAAILKTPLGAFLLGAYLAKEAMDSPPAPTKPGTKPWSQRSTWENLVEGAKEFWSLVTGHGGYTEDAPAPLSTGDNRTFWQRVAPKFLGGKDAPAAEATPGRQGMAAPEGPRDLGREGWYNNPGNIRASAVDFAGKGMPYTAGRNGEFETFETPELGVAAAVRNIRAKFKRGILTPEQLAPVLGPASDSNNPGWLAEQYAKALGIGVNDPIPDTPEAFRKLIPAITNIEKPYDARDRYTSDVYRKGVEAAFDPDKLSALLGNGGAAGAERTAESFAGRGEGDPQLRSFVRRASNLDPATAAWCAAFANASLAANGIEGTGSNVAASFLNWGRGLRPNEQVQKGDVVVLPRGREAGEVGGHVGIATGRVDPRTGAVEMISGNHGHRVELSREDPDDIVIRRATPALMARQQRREFTAAIPPANDNARSLADGFSLIRSAHAAERAPQQVVNGDTINNHSFGNIHVHTNATDAAGIAKDLAGELRKQFHVTHANRGLEP